MNARLYSRNINKNTEELAMDLRICIKLSPSIIVKFYFSGYHIILQGKIHANVDSFLCWSYHQNKKLL